MFTWVNRLCVTRVHASMNLKTSRLLDVLGVVGELDVK
jgi:hypothetical protein